MGDSSAEVEWHCHFQKKCLYYPFKEDPECKYGIIMMGWRKVESISRLIHEINECELSDLFCRLGVDDTIIKITNRMVRKYPSIFAEQKWGEVAITHIISPFGRRTCILDRKHNRVFW